MTERYNIDEEEWEQIFKQVKQWTQSSILRSFLWRMFAGNLYTRTDLMRFKISENSNCPFCEVPEQSKEHLFLQCRQVVAFWGLCRNKWEPILKKFALPEYEVLFGIRNNSNKNADEANLLIFMINKHIYFRNIAGKGLSLNALLNEITLAAKIEKDIFERKDQGYKFIKKWGNIMTMIEGPRE